MMHWPTWTKAKMKSGTPKISIITVCLNAVRVIDAAICSVLGQSFPDIEYIVIDGGSKDGTVDLLNKYQQQNKLRYISEADGGIYDAMNKGIKMATGEWIYFLGSDDVFLDAGVLQRVFARPFGEAEIVYGNVQYLHAGIIYDGPFDQEKISTKNICHQAMFVNRTVFEKIGVFNCTYKMSADYEFNIRWIGLNLPALYVAETVVIYNEKGMSGQVWDQVFYYDFDRLLFENNIVSRRSFMALKKKHEGVINSNRFKAGNFIIAPFSWLKNKISFFNK